MLETTGYVTVMILSRLFFGEKITLRKLGGMTLIIVGILVYNMLK